MGNVVAMCGLGPSHELSDAQLDFLKEDKRMLGAERSRAQSLGADSSVVSIISHSERLIPDAFQPVDIQVLSRGRRRSAVHNNSGSTTPSKAMMNQRQANVSINSAAEEADAAER
ncbi:hypothetical protein Poli38472_007793 [Pythium oligandrum]|uniref:Uncharacterized protein n=1 Tax=Pythium oligandrum TaxID=41045 RepID=A0A8K1CQS9_PYTOL|nr:hypothetical protein Poli38472_007793 [Pythium oligandrum]|eukprot:TMW68121.1 hypothetical protein Poli38472_007793 [Pythium oligandrum]